ncbi:M14 family zinc carboxypeptidase [Halpernia frigidisoli]|uniref:Zinc carboxypeptidase n=1 Tax=Halpernia frigidisoli TaxID=1125876 RepID=A0A1I3DMW5_9FLAO|nr:M14 family zinc carboxypeptidase [Halpernia frigidisoli]SFH88072.1 Zinc carboxypeptidase [Halpernia frigidisoli]
MNHDFKYQKNPDFPQRYISPQKLFNWLQKNYVALLTEIGKSTFGQPIFKFSFGSGIIKVAAWSQMHGNESTATLSMLDFLYSFESDLALKQTLEKSITLDFVFMLNPDGSEKWTRRNTMDIDLNRDYNQEESVEIKLLKNLISNGNYDYALNLHDQRTIFTTDGVNPATLSFLSPSENEEREVTENRKKSMAIIAYIFENLNKKLPNQIGRYSDEFYPNSVGDNLMKAGIPTILFEGGHFQNDYLRQETRKFYTEAFYFAILGIINLNGSTNNFENYFEIPENRETHFDVIYRNVTLNTDFPCILDVAVQFREDYSGGDEIIFTPIVVEVGDVGKKKGWKEIDCTGKFFKCEKKYPKLNEVQNFEIV